MQDAFGGKENEVALAISNKSAEGFEAKLSYTLFQLSFSITAPIGAVREWKTVEMRPGQTVLERVSLTLPEVKAATGFRVQILDGDQKTLGAAVVRRCPQSRWAASTVSQGTGGLSGVLAPARDREAAPRSTS